MLLIHMHSCIIKTKVALISLQCMQGCFLKFMSAFSPAQVPQHAPTGFSSVRIVVTVVATLCPPE